MTQASRQMRGQMAHYGGQAAEGQVAAQYEASGHRLVAQRWRGSGGELDLVFDDDESLVFVEVKKARSFDAALQRLRPRQIERICQTAEEYAGQYGERREMRFDLAVVNAEGAMHAMPNILAMG